MNTHKKLCLNCLILASAANLLLLYALVPNNILTGNNTAIYSIVVVGFLSSAFGIYFGMPSFDEDTGAKRSTILTLRIRLSLGFLNIALAIFLTPLVFFAWAAKDLESILAILTSFSI